MDASEKFLQKATKETKACSRIFDPSLPSLSSVKFFLGRFAAHRVLSRPGWSDVVFAFHDAEEIGPRIHVFSIRVGCSTPARRNLARRPVRRFVHQERNPAGRLRAGRFELIKQNEPTWRRNFNEK